MTDLAVGDAHSGYSPVADCKEKPKGFGTPNNTPRPVVAHDDVTRCHAAELVGTLLRQELARASSNTFRRDWSKREQLKFTFSQHTVTWNIDGDVVDPSLVYAELNKTQGGLFPEPIAEVYVRYELGAAWRVVVDPSLVYAELNKTQKRQVWVANEIEKAKRSQLKNYTQSEQAWRDDYRRQRYVSDATFASLIAKGFGDSVPGISTPYSCTCGPVDALTGPVETPDEEGPCYKCFDEATGGDIVVNKYVFNKNAASAHAHVKISPLPEVDI